MSLRSFLFTERIPAKYLRHIAFWICSILPFFMLGIISMYSKNSFAGAGKFIISQFTRFPNLLIDIVFTYTVVYYIIPLYRKNKNKLKLVAGLFVLILMAFIFKTMFWFSDVNQYQYHLHDEEKIWLSSWFLVTNFFNEGSLMRCALFLGCLSLKNYYIRSEEKADILRENATAELQLLKSQVHPHFLFNTLNNIYSFSLNRSPHAASLVLKLSDTLRYMITECEAPLVPLEKEMKMLKDYIGLESVRYGTRLNIEIIVKGSTNDKMIAPLLLIPLVENSFKHGTSQMLEQPWIKLNVNILENDLEFRLTNSKPEDKNAREGKNGIGLKNVQKRIQLLYPSQHEFKVNKGQFTFDVFVRVPLHNTKSMISMNRSDMVPELSIAYDNS